tara:strand:- start:116 stop:256 length:141 start_codon:yes stop_codon:yes gene_type:complete
VCRAINKKPHECGALMNILEDKGLITKQEVLGELQKLKVEHHKDVN